MTTSPKIAAVLAVFGVALCSCGGGEVVVQARSTTTRPADYPSTTSLISTTTLRPGTAPITFQIGLDDDHTRLRLRPGDEVVPRLPVTGLDDAGWVVTLAPNPAVLAGGDDLLWHPSEIDQGGVAFHEFDFIAAGPGETTVVLTHGWQEFTFTVVVSGLD